MCSIVNASDWSIPLVMESLEIISNLSNLIDADIYSQYVSSIHTSLLKIPEKISEEELKNSNKE